MLDHRDHEVLAYSGREGPTPLEGRFLAVLRHGLRVNSPSQLALTAGPILRREALLQFFGGEAVGRLEAVVIEGHEEAFTDGSGGAQVIWF